MEGRKDVHRSVEGQKGPVKTHPLDEGNVTENEVLTSPRYGDSFCKDKVQMCVKIGSY